MNCISSFVSTNRGRVITLYDNLFELLNSHADTEGRMAAIFIEHDQLKTSVLNVNCPNYHRASYVFIKKVYH